MQQRIFNYGDGFTQAAILAHTLGTFKAGPYNGLDIRITAPDRFSITPGVVLMPNGVMVVETTEFPVDPLIPLPSIPTTYTLKVVHEDIQAIGGQAATYTLVPAVSPATPSEIVLGYINYPGGGVALTSSMWTPTPRLRIDLYVAAMMVQANIDFLPPYGGLVVLGAHTTRTTVVSAAYLFDRFLSDGTTPSPAGDVSTFTFPQVAKTARPRRISVTHNLAVTSTLTITVVDTNGNPMGLGTISGTGILITTSLNIPLTGAFDTDKPYYFRLALTQQPLQTSDFGLIRLSHNPLP